MSALTSPGDQQALAEVERLREQGVAGVPALLDVLARGSWTVRRHVVVSLSGGSREVLEQLCRELVESRESEPVIAGLVDALSAASPDVDAAVRHLLDSTHVAVLCDAAQIAGRRQDAQSLSRLIDLTDHADDNVALASIEAIGRIGGSAALNRLIALAEGNNFFRVFPAIELLGRSRESRVLPTLQRLLKHPLYAAEAARAIGRIGSLAGVPALVQAMQNGSESVLRVGASSLVAIHDYAAQSLGPASAVGRAVREQAGTSLRDKIARAMSFSDDAETIALGRVLIWLKHEESVTDFLRLMTGPKELADLALEGLGQLSALGDPRLLAALETGSSELRSRLLPLFMGRAEASQAILACLDDEQAAVRALACHALSRGHQTAVVPRLFDLLRDADLGVVHAAIGAIQALGSAETERLALVAAASGDAAERRAGLRIVTYFGYPRAFDLCLEALATGDEKLRDIALGGLPPLDDARVPSVLIGAAEHASGRTRASAIRALGHVAATAQTEQALRRALEDSEAWVRYYACQSLGRLGITTAMPLIRDRLMDSAGQVRMAAVEALALLPGEPAADALAALATSSDLELQRAAIVGIGGRANPRLRPVVVSALASSDATIRAVALSSLVHFERSEVELGAAAASDPDASVRRAAVDLLASRDDVAASQTLLGLLTKEPDSTAFLLALAQHADARISSIVGALPAADDALSRALLSVLSRSESREARLAIDTAFGLSNVAARRAAARVLSLLLDDAAKSSLARATSADSDAEVRRICAAALA